MTAFERYDIDALTALMRQDATLCMPPITLWLRGVDTIRAWMLGRGAECRGSRLIPAASNGEPAFGQYRSVSGVYRAWALVVLELDGDRIRTTNAFLDVQTLFPRFGLPFQLER